MSIQIIDLFIRMREMLATHKDLLIRLEQLEKKWLQQDQKMSRHSEDIRQIFEYLKELLRPDPEPRKRIGYAVKRDTS